MCDVAPVMRITHHRPVSLISEPLRRGFHKVVMPNDLSVLTARNARSSIGTETPEMRLTNYRWWTDSTAG